jgi:hypothetical protein
MNFIQWPISRPTGPISQQIKTKRDKNSWYFESCNKKPIPWKGSVSWSLSHYRLVQYSKYRTVSTISKTHSVQYSKYSIKQFRIWENERNSNRNLKKFLFLSFSLHFAFSVNYFNFLNFRINLLCFSAGVKTRKKMAFSVQVWSFHFTNKKTKRNNFLKRKGIFPQF